MLDNIMVLHFSPTGGTRRAARLLAGAVAAQAGETDLTLPQAQAHRFGPEDVVLVAGPVYGGRLPALMVQRLRDCHGGGARALPAPVQAAISQKLAPFAEKRAENELFL